MLEGQMINLRIAEKDDVPLLVQWFNDVQFAGAYQNFPVQITGSQLERQILEHKLYGHEWVDFLVEKKDGTKIGWATHYISAPNFGWIEIGYNIIPTEKQRLRNRSHSDLNRLPVPHKRKHHTNTSRY